MKIIKNKIILKINLTLTIILTEFQQYFYNDYQLPGTQERWIPLVCLSRPVN